MGRFKDIAMDNLIQQEAEGMHHEPEPEPEYVQPEPQWVHVLSKFSPIYSSHRTHSQIVVDIYSDLDMALQDLRDLRYASTDTDEADYLYQITAHRIIKP